MKRTGEEVREERKQGVVGSSLGELLFFVW